MTAHHLAARAGRWSAHHRKVAVLGWIGFVIAAVVVGGAIGTRQIASDDFGVGESGRAQSILHREFPQPATEQVLVASRTVTASDPAFRRVVRDVAARLARVPESQNVRSPLDRGQAGAISRDRRSALIQLQVVGEARHADKKVGSILAATAAAQRSHPGFLIREAGDASADKALQKSFNDDFARARVLSIPITLVILILAFGALVAAGIPVLLAISGVVAALGLIAIPSHIAAVDPAISEVVLLVGLAVGVDYSLFYLRREREERARGRNPEAALEAAAATSGRSVLISGLTVMTAMAGMYLSGNKTFGSFATGTILVVAVAMTASLTVLPALLSKLGDRVMKGRVPVLARRREANEEPRVWGRVVDLVLRRPGLAVALSAGGLVLLAIPAFSLHTLNPGLQGLPQDLPIVKTLNSIESAFPGGPQPAQVVIRGPSVTDPTTSMLIRRLTAKALATGKVRPPVEVHVNRARTVAVVSLPLSGTGTDARSLDALQTLRNDIIPSTVGLAPGVSMEVTGNTALSTDFNDSLKAHIPIVFAFVLAMAFLLLLVTFRSIVIPLKAIVLNLLSVGASYGVLVLVFQHRWAEGLLGFKSIGGITSWLPMFLFVILFGLSMDYHVFILSRVREAVDNGQSTEAAVAHGIKTTAGVVTSAAAVMVAVFAIFASLGALEFKQLGVGLAVAIFIDATVVRAILLPASMILLGDWNWYLPRWMGWMPRRAVAATE
ncbi:MAG TPA: MMPL family transporter [Thermoleophilaceae bacterium]|jgi:RND superfamily putative drug exporter|nr:MMPL family transporter [Thermoleophilaceae bacterium]